MPVRLLLSIVPLIVAASAAIATATPLRFAVQPEASAVTFKATSRLVNADGKFHRFSGIVSVDPADPATARVSITVEAASIDTRNTRRDQHLRTDDFFDVERFPSITFESTRFDPATRTLRGRLTVRGITREVAMPLEVELTERAFRARGEFSIKRSEYGMTYNSSFNPVGDVVRVAVDLRGQVMAP